GLSMGVDQHCKNKTELDVCLAKIAPHMPKAGLPHDKKQLDKMCRSFKVGMGCVDGYTNKCMDNEERDALEEHLKGARYVLAFLCDDPMFQREYLANGQCLEDVTDDWDRCHAHFKHRVSREHALTNTSPSARDRNICCIREELLTCVYGVGYLKCTPSSAVFLKKVTATLSYSDVQQEKCQHITHRSCNSSSLTRVSSRLLILLYLFWLHKFKYTPDIT
ncbi:unnamed protein product, partial [Meganyctiphanes norvegica]